MKEIVIGSKQPVGRGVNAATEVQIQEMHPQMVEPFFMFERAMLYAGLPFRVTSVARFVKEQVALYAQGREDLRTTNSYRALAGMRPITALDNSRKVTWTLKSDHLVDLDDGDKDNDYSRAFDIVLLYPNNLKKVHWDLKVSVNDNNIPDYREAAEIGRKCGLTPGFFWKKPDPPHYSFKVTS